MTHFLVLFALLSSSLTEFDLVKDPSFVLSFAEQLEREGDHFAAISEYKRYMYLMGEDVDSVLYKIAGIYQKVGLYENAVDIMQRMKESGSRYRFELGRIYFLAGNYRQARDSWEPLHRDTLTGLTLLREGNFQGAGELLGPIGTPPRKSPLLAGILSSAVPGSGRVYAGRAGDGIFSFLVTLGSGVIAYSYYRSDRNLPALGFGALSAFLYLGEIYGSANSSRIYNEKEEEDFVKAVEAQIGLERLLEAEW